MGLASDVTYRDRPITCPRCGVELARADERNRWKCLRCTGELFGVGELVHELLVVAPDLLPAGGVRGITTLGRRTIAPTMTCPACAAPMEPVFLGGVDVDRCYRDDLIWFDVGELTRVLEVTNQQREQRTSWFAKLFR